MSETYIQRLRGVQAEMDASREAMTYVEKNWQRLASRGEVERMRPRDLREVSRNVEATYFIRLFAEFEGILKDHLATNHPRIRVPDRPQVDWLIAHVIQVESLTLAPALRLKMDAVRNYRNSIAHRTRTAVLPIRLVEGLSTLNTFLARLPEPFS